jgi:hypothetical protein
VNEFQHYTDIPQSPAAMSDADRKTMIRGYYASVSFIDAQIGKLINKLKSTYDADGRRLYDNTVIIVYGDHGWQLYEHGLWFKHSNYRTSLQAPLLIRDTDFPGGQRSGRLTELVDVYPTLCELTGLGPPASDHLEGTSLVPLLEDPNRSWKQAIFGRHLNADTIVTERYSYTQYTNTADSPNGEMLYDLALDPDENTNIASSNSTLVSELRGLLGSTPTEKRNAWKAFADLNNSNTPVTTPLELTAASHPAAGYPITDPAPAFPQIGILEVIRTDTGGALFELEDAMLIDPYQLASRELSIRASVPEIAGGSVIFELNGEVIRTLNAGPFSLGAHDGSNYGAWFPGAGEHALRVIPYSQPDGLGTAGDPVVRRFTVEDTLEHRMTPIRLSVPANATIEVTMKQHEFPFGAMLNAELFHDRKNEFSPEDEAQYKQTFLENFNYAVHGNAMKWYSVEPDWWINSPGYDGTKRWSDAELVWDWASANGIPMRGHSVFWGMDTATNSGQMWDPDWVEALNDADLEATAEERARDFASRWAGRIDQIDSNNEMWHGNYYRDRLGNDITRKMHD